jgi:DNA-binding LacI/PurR family transcriptional regulator
MNTKSMREVALLAGVSVATVSRSYKMPNKVSSATRAKVLEAARQLGYIYNAAVGDVTGKRSTILGMLVPKIGYSLFGSSLTAVQAIAAQKGFSVVLGCTNYDDVVERRLLKQFQERRLGAIILTGYVKKNHNLIHELIDAGLPCVVIWEKIDSPNISYVGIDNRKAAFVATSHLLSLGHRRIGLIAGPFSVMGRVHKRVLGYRDALDEYAVPYDPELVIERPPSLIEGRAAAEHLLSLVNPPTSLFAASDILAIGAMQAIHMREMKMPQDISLVGFDDIEFAAYMNPPLSSVRVDAYEMGRLAAEIAIEMASGPIKNARQYCLDTDLIIRETSGPRPKKI